MELSFPNMRYDHTMPLLDGRVEIPGVEIVPGPTPAMCMVARLVEDNSAPSVIVGASSRATVVTVATRTRPTAPPLPAPGARAASAAKTVSRGRPATATVTVTAATAPDHQRH